MFYMIYIYSYVKRHYVFCFGNFIKYEEYEWYIIQFYAEWLSFTFTIIYPEMTLSQHMQFSDDKCMIIIIYK